MSARVGIVGGGVAGLAAAVALVERGCRVELFEARRKLGGRAGSYVDRETGEAIDHCQHVAMGCCTNYLDFCRRTEIDGLFTRYSRLHFFGPDGKRSDFEPSQWLPAPLHLVGPLAALKYLSWREKWAIARAMLKLARMSAADAAEGPTVLEWLISERQSVAAIERFWKVVLVSALGESLDRASLAAARKVFVDGFLGHRRAADVLVPNVSLDELYDRRVAGWLRERGAGIHVEAPVEAVTGDGDRATGLLMASGREEAFDFVICAVPWSKLPRLLPPEMLDAADPKHASEEIASAPISSVHLWFDRPIMDLPHGVLVGRLSQWVFARNFERGASEHYYQVVISASHDLAGRERESVVEEVLEDLRSVFPDATTAQLVRAKLITESQAVFSVRPGLDARRPRQQTAIPNLLLAGDWTRTGWPATMEGAVRSGYLAAEGVLERLGRAEQIVVADLPRGWLARGFRL
jgi:squalene-associated FAD-dependent desaturase